jgi:hypothetical protein
VGGLLRYPGGKVKNPIRSLCLRKPFRGIGLLCDEKVNLDHEAISMMIGY